MRAIDAVALLVLILIVWFLLWQHVPSPIAIAIVSGKSMLPAIKSGSVAIGVAEKPRVGDVVIVKIGDRYVIHRVISINGTMLQTKGDNNTHPDPPVPIFNARYVVVKVIPPPASYYLLSLICLLIIGIGIYFISRAGEALK
jgi:signal peptidase I